MKHLFSFLLLALSFTATAQTTFNNSTLAYKIWDATTGNPDTLDWSASTLDVARSLIVAGNTITGSNLTDLLLTKYNQFGSLVWQVQYNHSYNNKDYGTAVVTDVSKNIYVAGTSITSSANSYDFVVLKYDSNGNQQWAQLYNGPGSSYDVATDLKVDGSGNVYVCGTSTGSTTLLDYCTIKYNNSGTQQWVSRYDYTSLTDVPAAITINSTGKIVVTGGSGSTLTNWDFATVKYNATTGAETSANRVNSGGIGYDLPTAIAKDQYDNIYVTGRAASVSNGYNIRTVKMDTGLNHIWTATYNGVGLDDQGNTIGVDAYGNVYVAGYTMKTNGGMDWITIKYNNGGTFQWGETVSAPDETKNAEAKRLDIDPFGNILVAGYVHNLGNNDFYFLGYDASGNKKFEEWYDGTGKGDDVALSIRCDIDNYFYVTGKTWTGSAYGYVTMKYEMIDYITPPTSEECPTSFAYYENLGQIMGTNDTLQPSVKYYTEHHYPDLYLQNSKLSFVFSRVDTSVSTDDTLHRIDMKFKNSNSTNVCRISPRSGAYLNYFKPWCEDGITTFGYQRLLYPELYDDIDLMLYGNGAGMKLYFICDVGGKPDDIILKFQGASSVTILGNGKLQITSSIGSFTYDPPAAYQIDANGDSVGLSWSPIYVSLGSNEFRFSTSTYDASKPIVFEMKEGPEPQGPNYCDANICWSTYIGDAAGTEAAYDVVTDLDDKVYICGTTGSIDFPITTGLINNYSGSLDALVVKFDEVDEAVWMTFYGGTSFEFATAIDMVSAAPFGQIIFGGRTMSQDFVGINFVGSTSDYFYEDVDLFEAGFIASINNMGTFIEWAVTIEDHLTVAYEMVEDIVIDNSGNIYAVGYGIAASPVAGPSGSYLQFAGKAASLTMFSPTYQKLWSTYFGCIYNHNVNGCNVGWPSDLYDAILAAQIDDDGNLWISGRTLPESTTNTCTGLPSNTYCTFPVCNSVGASYFQTVTQGQPLLLSGTPNYEAFIATFDPSHALIYSTLYGGNRTEEARDLKIANDNVYITGVTLSTTGQSSSNYCTVPTSGAEFPLCNPSQTTHGGGFDDAFVAVFDIATGDIEFSTYLGGSDDDLASAMATDLSNNIFVTGHTYSPNFPHEPLSNYYDHEQFEWGDQFITKYSPSYNILWSTYYGGSVNSGTNLVTNETGYGIDINDNYQMYVVGAADCKDYPITYLNNAYHQTFGNCNNCSPDLSDAVIFRMNVDPNVIGVEEVSDYDFFAIYPNPGSGTFTVELPANYNLVRIEDILGREVYRNVFSPSLQERKIEINLSELVSGVYLFTISESFTSITTKIVLQQ